jgi:O-antigen ligase
MAPVGTQATDAKPQARALAGHRAEAAVVETALLAALVAGLAWAPFYAGSHGETPWAVNAVYFPALAAIYEISLVARGRAHPVALARLAVPAGSFVVAVLWIFLQTSRSVPAQIAHPIWGLAAEGLRSPLAGAISVNPDETAMALMRLVTETSVLWLSLQICRDQARAMILFEAFAAIVAIYAVYGIALTAFYDSKIPFFRTPDAAGAVRSTFVNRNNFATWDGLGLVTVSALLARFYRHHVRHGSEAWSYRMRELLEKSGWRLWTMLGMWLVMFAALLGTGSRGGVVATAAGLGTVALLFSRRQERLVARGIGVLMTVAGAVAMVLLILLFGDALLGRLLSSGVSDSARLATYRITIKAIADAPVLGFGYGAFADTFALYRDQSMSSVGVWEMAHNTYLEVWLGLGLVFGTLLIVAVCSLAWQCLVGGIRRIQNATPAIIGASCSVVVGLHAAVDFSLQVQAVTISYTALLGAGVAQSFSSRMRVSD